MLSVFQFLQPGLNFFWQVHVWQGVIQSLGPMLPSPHANYCQLLCGHMWEPCLTLIYVDTSQRPPVLYLENDYQAEIGSRDRWFCLIWRLFKWCSGNNRLLMEKVNLLIVNFLKLWFLIRNSLMSGMLVLFGESKASLDWWPGAGTLLQICVV